MKIHAGSVRCVTAVTDGSLRDSSAGFHFPTALPTPATVGIRRGRAGRAAESAGHDLTETGGDVLTSRLSAPGGREHATRHYATEEEMGELGLVESGVPSSVPGRTIPRRRALGRGNHQARKQPAQKTLSSHGSSSCLRPRPRFHTLGSFLAEGSVPCATPEATARSPSSPNRTAHTHQSQTPQTALADGGGGGGGREGEEGRARRRRARVGARAAVRLRAGDDADGRRGAGRRAAAQAAAAAAAAAFHRRSAPELRPPSSRQALRPRPDPAEVGERGGGGPEGRRRRRRRREQRQPAARAAPVAVSRAGGGGEAGGRGGQQRGARGAAGAGLGGAVRAPPLGHDAGGRELPAQRRRRAPPRRGAGPGRRRRRAARRRGRGRVVGRARGLRRHRRRRARARQAPLLKP